MSEVVLDASAVLALLRDEPGADIVAGHMGNAAISAVNLQEVAKEMFREGASCADVRAILKSGPPEYRRAAESPPLPSCPCCCSWKATL